MSLSEPTQSASPRPFEIVALVAIILGTVVPFLNKAFHIDDPLYLAVARQILVDPLDPYGAKILWEKQPELLFDADFNPPLWNYALAAVLRFTGEPTVQFSASGEATASRIPEISLHLLESLFVAAALWACFLLARRFTHHPLLATILIAWSPAWLPGQNIMLEGPVMAFWLWAILVFLIALDRNSAGLVWLAGVLAAGGVMTKYTSALVLILFLAICLRHRFWKGLWSLAPCVLALACWVGHNWIYYERAHLFVIFSRIQTGERVGQGIAWSESFGRMWALLRLIGSLSLISLALVYGIAKRVGVWSALLICAAALAAGVMGCWDMSLRLEDRGMSLNDLQGTQFLPRYSGSIHATWFGANGAVLLLSVLLPWRHQDGSSLQARFAAEWFLWFWLLLVAMFCVFAVPFLAVRHFLVGVVPLTLLAMRRFEWIGIRGTVKLLLAACTALTAALGFLVARGDYDFAEWYRHLALDVSSRVVRSGQENDVDVWFTGHWGWAYYARRAGAHPYLDGSSQLRDKDLFLMPMIQTWKWPESPTRERLHRLMPSIKPNPDKLGNRGPIAATWAKWSHSIRTISTETHYYSGGTLNLPWRFSLKPLDDFLVLEYREE